MQLSGQTLLDNGKHSIKRASTWCFRGLFNGRQPQTWHLATSKAQARLIKPPARRHVDRASAVQAQAEAAPEEEEELATRDEDTIVAIVTGSVSQGAVSIIRVSGTEALAVAYRVFRPGGLFRMGWQPRDHAIHYGNAVDGDERVLDEVLLLCMRSPRSYTCEDVIELHTHGGGVCSHRVLQACVEAGARLARPGEFTLRAFLNGRLDLAQAEAVTSLLTARTAAAADSALAGLRGGLGDLVARLRRDALALLAEVEARIDFDEDLPALDTQRLQQQVEGLQAGIEGALRTSRQGTLLRQGLSVAIVGRPNVGKSSLLNAWTRTERAIVTDIAGTTRDVLEAGLVVAGVPLTLLDTAGIRHSVDLVEKLGVERSRAAAAAADIVLMVVDAQASCSMHSMLMWVGNTGGICRSASQPVMHADNSHCTLPTHGLPLPTPTALTDFDCAIDHGSTTPHAAGSSPSGSSPTLLSPPSLAGPSRPASPSISLPLLAREVFQAVVHTSAHTGRGLDQLDKALLALAGAPQLANGAASWAVNERQAEALLRAHEALMKVSESMQAALPIDFWTIDLRNVLIALGEVSGDEVTEEVLDNVFSRFCLGK
ncbi:hypothetical protein V8C86DRAFT_3028768 [Haematococcus lacustris]